MICLTCTTMQHKKDNWSNLQNSIQRLKIIPWNLKVACFHGLLRFIVIIYMTFSFTFLLFPTFWDYLVGYNLVYNRNIYFFPEVAFSTASVFRSIGGENINSKYYKQMIILSFYAWFVLNIIKNLKINFRYNENKSYFVLKESYFVYFFPN